MGILDTSVSGLVGIAGVAVGSLLTYFFGGRASVAERRAQFRTRQLDEFYGPLLSLRKEILARSNLRAKIQQTTDREYTKHPLEAGPKGRDAVVDEYLPVLHKMIEDENQTFRNILMPQYRQMVIVFREKMWLAEPETRAHFNSLVEFVDVWDKILNEALPRSVAPALGHTEENLKPLYRNLEDVHDKLRAEFTGDGSV